MKKILLSLLLVTTIMVAGAQKLTKFAEVDYNHSVRLKGAYSSYYGGHLAIGNFQSLIIPPVNGQTIAYGNVAIVKADGTFVRLDNGLPEQTTAGCIIGEVIYAGTISGNVYKYTEDAGWNLIFSANARIYNITDIGAPNLLVVGEFTAIDGNQHRHIAIFNTTTGAICSLATELPSLNNGIQMYFEECEVVTTNTTAYITWINMDGMSTGLYSLDKQTLALTPVSNPTTNLGYALATDGNTVYFCGMDVVNNERRVWKIEPTGTPTELFTLLGGGPAISGMTVSNGNLYFTGYFTGTSTSSTVKDAGIYSLTTGTISPWYATDGNIPLSDVVAIDGNLLASTGYALYTSVQLSTGISDPDNTTTALTIYPNPVSTTLTVITNERTALVITNTIGQTLIEQTVEKGTHTLNLDGLPNGTLFVNGKSIFKR